MRWSMHGSKSMDCLCTHMWNWTMKKYWKLVRSLNHWHIFMSTFWFSVASTASLRTLKFDICKHTYRINVEFADALYPLGIANFYFYSNLIWPPIYFSPSSCHVPMRCETKWLSNSNEKQCSNPIDYTSHIASVEHNVTYSIASIAVAIKLHQPNTIERLLAGVTCVLSNLVVVFILR